jgi:general stress protein 26
MRPAMGESTKAHLKELLTSFDNAMLITHSGEQTHARPMAVAEVEGTNIVWFVTGNHSPKAEEIRDDSRASATFQSSDKFVALSGIAQLSSDKAKIEQLWKPSWKAWFPNGKDDPNIALIRLNVTDAEFWDNAGTKGIRYAFEAAKAVLTGTTPQQVEGQHARVNPATGNAPTPTTKH